MRHFRKSLLNKSYSGSLALSLKTIFLLFSNLKNDRNLQNLGLSSKAIAWKLAVSRTTVFKWIRREEETGILTDLGNKLRFSLCQ